MGRKIWSGTLMTLSAIFLIVSLVGIGAAWYYNTPLTQEITSRLQEIDSELSQAQSALTNAQGELERALRIVDCGGDRAGGAQPADRPGAGYPGGREGHHR